MNGQAQSTEDELTHHRTWAMTLATENELWIGQHRKGEKRMGITCARVKKNLDQASFVQLKSRFVETVTILDVKTANNNPYAGWVRHLVVRCISGHSSGAVELDLTTPASRGALAHDRSQHPDPDCKIRSPSGRSSPKETGRPVFSLPFMGQKGTPRTSLEVTRKKVWQFTYHY